MVYSARFALLFLLLAGQPVSPEPANTPEPVRHLHTRHFDLYAATGSPAETDLETIARSREEALSAVARLFETSPPKGIRLTFYRDEATKKAATGHAGLGWAEGKVIEEVYSSEIHLDPYHELAHIVGASVGHPPALIDEGFAVYISEHLGADALALLGHPNTPINVVGCKLISDQLNLPLEQLFDFTELGSPESKGPISYPQSASVIKYLVDTYGLRCLLLAYRTLRGSHEPSVRSSNRLEFSRIYGQSVPAIEDAWMHTTCDPTPNPAFQRTRCARR
jgi:hypothetical protein